MKKQTYIKLPVQEPVIQCITQDAYLQAVGLNSAAFYPWMMGQFAQVWACDPRIAAGGVFLYFVAPSYWFACPHLYTQEMSKETINVRYDRIADFLTDSLSLGQYVILPVNRRFIDAFHDDGDGTHDMMIHGYDMTKGLFYIADFFEGNFRLRTCPFEDMENAYFTDTVNPLSWHNTVRLVSPDHHRRHFDFHLAASHDFDTQAVCTQLADYIRGENSLYRYRIRQKQRDSYGHTVGGIRVYDVLMQYVRESVPAEGPLDHRIFYILWAHKHMLTLRAEFMGGLDDARPAAEFAAPFREIEDQARTLLNKVLKRNLKGSGLSCSDVEDALASLRDREVEVIGRFLEMLEKG